MALAQPAKMGISTIKATQAWTVLAQFWEGFFLYQAVGPWIRCTRTGNWKAGSQGRRSGGTIHGKAAHQVGRPRQHEAWVPNKDPNRTDTDKTGMLRAWPYRPVHGRIFLMG